MDAPKTTVTVSGDHKEETEINIQLQPDTGSIEQNNRNRLNRTKMKYNRNQHIANLIVSDDYFHN